MREWTLHGIAARRLTTRHSKSFARGVDEFALIVMAKALDLDTSAVTDMSYMFNYAISLNQALDLDTSAVTTMEFMFAYASSFNQALDFDTSSMTSMHMMV